MKNGRKRRLIAFMISADRKALIIAESIPKLSLGISTEVIGKEYGIDGSTLRRWLVNDPSAEDARAEFLTERLMESLKAIDEADDVFPLARAREQFRAWSWMAERRLPSRFGPKAEIAGLAINIMIARNDGEQMRVVSESDTDLT